ncbi:uncharacterized protein LOC135099795 [Scylla paramamosain]|uniref:uncharacterized protein LOC135099795 n=1 Tax=Scylla paramamosain TaxID=85552 RepID=UPI003083BB06
MRTYKYSILVIAAVVGTEVIFKCLKHIYNVFYYKSGDKVKHHVTSWDSKKQRSVNEVIFFPDQGILSSLTASNTSCRKQNLIVMEENSGIHHLQSSEKCHQSRFITRSFSLNENEVPHSAYLKKSSSLIHLVDVLDSARCSLKVCVYIITLQDLVDALVRAKNRGVHVRVIVEGQMPNEAALATLRKNNISARISQSSQLMHHKFALVDVPNPYCPSVIPGNATPTEIHEKSWLGWFSSYLFFRSSFSQSATDVERPESLLLTGSFNWTWTAVVNNCENVIISNDLNLINHYNEEFDFIWKAVEVSS